MAPKAKKEAPQPQSQPTHPPAPAAATQLGASKQQMTLEKLKAEWVKRGVDVSKIATAMDGKFMLVTVAPDWPVIKIGPSGGGELPQLKSYPKFFDAAIHADELWKKQQERMAKKAAPVDAKKPQAAVGKQPGQIDGDTGNVVDKETPTAKKARAHGQIEQRLQTQA